jgi:hypothetical protein
MKPAWTWLFFSRATHQELLGAVNLQKALPLSRFVRPLHLESIALHILRVQVAPRNKSTKPQLAAVLPQAPGQPTLNQGISTARAWETIAGDCSEDTFRAIGVIMSLPQLHPHHLEFGMTGVDEPLQCIK